MTLQVNSIRTEHAKYLLGPDPKVTLLYATPEWVIAQATQGYAGKYSAEPMTEAEQALYWKELGDTKLKGPLEMASTFWLLENVDRGFTHQLARYRIGTSMVQESQRFSVQDEAKAVIAVPTKVAADDDKLEDFMDAGETAMHTYMELVEAGTDVQDARGVLPTNICTRLYLSVAVNSLAHLYSQRSCCQAQSDTWGKVIAQMKSELLEKGFHRYANLLIAPWEDKRCVSCGFGANFDRPCRHQNKFDANLDALYWAKG